MYIRHRLVQLILFSLITAFLYNSAGYFFVFRYVQSCLEIEMDTKLKSIEEHEQLITLTFKKREICKINWIKKGKEFSFNGKRYDISNITETPDSYIFWCMNDEEEDRLLANLNNCNSEDWALPSKNKPSRKGRFFFNPLYFSNKNSSSFQIPVISVVPTASSSLSYSFIYIEINYPPPRFA